MQKSLLVKYGIYDSARRERKVSKCDFLIYQNNLPRYVETLVVIEVGILRQRSAVMAFCISVSLSLLFE
jgi:hypothetical protein